MYMYMYCKSRNYRFYIFGNFRRLVIPKLKHGLSVADVSKHVACIPPCGESILIHGSSLPKRVVGISVYVHV